MGYCKCGVAHCNDPSRLSLCSLDLSHWVSGGDPILWSFYIWEVIAANWHAHTHTYEACCCLLCQVKSRHYNTCMHVFVHAVEPVKCGTVILLQQIMSADSARQCEQSERGCCCWFALLPPLSGEKSRHCTHLHARVCARSGTCQMWDRNSATTDRHVCRQCKTMRAVRERLLLLVCIVGLASCSDHAEHC